MHSHMRATRLPARVLVRGRTFPCSSFRRLTTAAVSVRHCSATALPSMTLPFMSAMMDVEKRLTRNAAARRVHGHTVAAGRPVSFSHSRHHARNGQTRNARARASA